MNNEVIGKKIAKLRNKRKMTQIELAKLIHVSDKTISKWEQGNSQVSYEYLEELCKVFNVKMNYFYSDVNLEKSIKNFLHKLWTFIKMNWLTLVFALTTFFFGYYYFITIDSLEMYEISSEDKNVTFDSGYYIKSKSKVIICQTKESPIISKLLFPLPMLNLKLMNLIKILLVKRLNFIQFIMMRKSIFIRQMK